MNKDAIFGFLAGAAVLYVMMNRGGIFAPGAPYSRIGTTGPGFGIRGTGTGTAPPWMASSPFAPGYRGTVGTGTGAAAVASFL